MSLHDIELKQRLSRFLARKAAPRHLTAPEAQADEIAALLRALRTRAPRDPDALRDWWQGLEAGLDERCGRNWPTVRDFSDAAAALAPLPGTRPAEPRDVDSAVMTAGRMRAGEPVGEGWLYGLAACELIARGLVDRDRMEAYRSGAFRARARIYGEDEARRWEAEAKARHEEARVLWQARADDRQKRDVSRYARPGRMSAA